MWNYVKFESKYHVIIFDWRTDVVFLMRKVNTGKSSVGNCVLASFSQGLR